MKKLAIVVLSIATAFSGMPAWAGPAFVASPVQSTQPANGPANDDAQILNVGCNNFTKCPGQFHRGRHYGNGNYSNRNWDRDDRDWGDRHWNGNNRRYYGDRYRYGRYHNNNGAVIGGLVTGAIIGGIIASQSRVNSYDGGSHAEYCYSRYRSYRAYDNTYQPNYGPRRQCR